MADCPTPIPLTLCNGPACGPLGQQELLAAYQRLPAAERQRLVLRYQHCFARCQLPTPCCPAAKLGETWLWPPTAASLRQALTVLPPPPPPPPPPTDPFARYFPPA